MILVFAITLIACSLPSVSADLGYYCVGNSTFYNWTEDGTVHNMTTPCINGCSDGACISDGTEGTFPMVFILGYIIISAIMAYLAMNVDREQHGHIQILFIFLSLYFTMSALVGIQVVMDIKGILLLSGLNNTMLTVMSWVSWFILGYVIIIFLYNLFTALADMAQNRRTKKRGGLKPLKM